MVLWKYNIMRWFAQIQPFCKTVISSYSAHFLSAIQLEYWIYSHIIFLRLSRICWNFRYSFRYYSSLNCLRDKKRADLTFSHLVAHADHVNYPNVPLSHIINTVSFSYSCGSMWISIYNMVIEEMFRHCRYPLLKWTSKTTPAFPLNHDRRWVLWSSVVYVSLPVELWLMLNVSSGLTFSEHYPALLSSKGHILYSNQSEFIALAVWPLVKQSLQDENVAGLCCIWVILHIIMC